MENEKQFLCYCSLLYSNLESLKRKGKFIEETLCKTFQAFWELNNGLSELTVEVEKVAEAKKQLRERSQLDNELQSGNILLFCKFKTE